MAFTIDPDQLAESVTMLEGYERRLEQLIADAEARVRRMHGFWQGTAATMHLDAHRRWQADIAAMREALTELRQIAATAHANYTSAIAANTAMWSGL